MQPQGSPPVAVSVDEVQETQPEERCEYCGKARHELDRKGRVGSNLGSSAVLGRNMLEGRELSTHAWYAGPFSLAAHHLICLEALDDPEWARYCTRFGYHPDRRGNGIFLPMKMALACQLSVPVHRGNHAEGFAYDVHLPYPKAVKKKLKEVADDIEAGKYCSNPEALVRKLDKISAEILSLVAKFTWTLTRDGLDYAPGSNGCAGLKSISDKPSVTPCPQGRRHQMKHAMTGLPLAKRVLEVGE
ncbi:AHH domain-containing protein [Pyxidicoccus parkwayensis]|uniref:AHH domain-containing protein n=2 Tax=Pyxidicoccus parkwayensis TaxID=2813578 RepID=A0ABX7PDH5_9BACT|nr:AHH domain-containing protein [Pyxidicoccus parkwaysis]